MFPLGVEVAETLGTAKEPLAYYLETLLEEICKEFSFEDETDFLSWMQETLPLLHWKKTSVRQDQEECFIYVFANSSFEYSFDWFLETFKKKIFLGKELPTFSFQHSIFQLKRISGYRFSLLEFKFLIEEPDESKRIFDLLHKLSGEIILSLAHPKAHWTKSFIVNDKLVKVKRRFQQRIEESIFEEANCLLSLLDPKFIEERTPQLLIRLIFSQYFIRKALLRSIGDISDFRHVAFRMIPSYLNFPFTSKTGLGVFVGIHFLHKYELFSEEHLLRALQKIMPDLQHIAGGVYSFQQHKDPFKFLYIEVEKKGGLPFSLVERKLLRQNLKEVLKRGVERLHPSIFMLSNEEEIVKNILLLSREIRVLKDLPQVMIHFDEQSEKEVSFQVLVAYLGKKDLSLSNFFKQSQVAYLPLREQIVRHLRKKYPVRAQFFKLTLSKTSEMLRSDLSLNFYAAREKICSLLSNAFGEFRDYNGGLILKQGETLTKFKEAFSNSSSELLENFFYAITPIEAQATLPLNSLSILFELFVEGQNHCLLRKKDHFAKVAQYEGETYAFFKIKGRSDLEQFIEEFKHLQKYLISVRLGIEDATCLCYLFRSNVIAEHSLFITLFHRAIESWKNEMKGVKTLRLAIHVNFFSLDPRIQGDEETKVILKMLFEGLMRFDPSGKLICGMAESVKISRDKKKYTFQLRPAHWSNDTLVMANDFVYAWRTLLSPHFKTPFAYLFYPIKNAQEIKEGRLDPICLGVRALDKNTLEIQLNSPTPYFLELLAQPQFSPIHATIDQLHPTWSNQEGEGYVCNGAFLLHKKYSYQGCELVKNPYYHDATKIQIDRVTIKSAPPSEIKEMFIRDEIDWFGYPMGAVNLSCLPLNHGETIALPNDSLYWYVFNTQQYPFHLEKIRKAFALVVNRAQILQAISPAHWPAFTPISLKYSQACPLEESQHKGKALFEQALQELQLDRSSFPVVKLIHCGEQDRDIIAKIIKQQWEESFGIRCRIDTFEWNTLFNRLFNGEFQVAGLNWINLIDDPSYTLNIFRNSSPQINFPRWHDEKYAAFLDRAEKETSPRKKFFYYEQAEEILCKQVPVLPLLCRQLYSIKKKRLEIVNHRHLKNWDLKWASISNLEV